MPKEEGVRGGALTSGACSLRSSRTAPRLCRSLELCLATPAVAAGGREKYGNPREYALCIWRLFGRISAAITAQMWVTDPCAGCEREGPGPGAGRCPRRVGYVALRIDMR